jgi:hypothetical protein
LGKKRIDPYLFSSDLSRVTSLSGSQATCRPVRAASGATGLNLRFTAADVTTITTGSDFDRTLLGISGISGIGNTLMMNLGGPSNQLSLSGSWTNLGNTSFGGTNYTAYQQGNSLFLM